MTGYPWKTGDELLANDLNAAIANAAIGGSNVAGGDLAGTYPNPTVAKINGSAPAPSATTDTTNANNISSGQLPAARLPTTAVTPGSYTAANITVDATGRLTGASNGAAGGSVSSVATAGAGIAGGPITTSGTLTVAWNGPAVNALGTGLSAAGGTLVSTVVAGTGTVTKVDTGAGLSGGPITTAGTLVAQWQAGTVSSMSGLSLAGGVLTAAPAATSITGQLAYSQLPTEVQQLPIAFAFAGKPSASAVVNVPMPMAITVPASLAGAVVYDTTKTTSNAVFTVNKISSGGITPTAWNPTDLVGTIVLSNANLTATFNNINAGVRAVIGASPGKYYWECTIGSVFSSYAIGMALVSASLGSGGSVTGNTVVLHNGGIFANNVNSGSALAALGSGDIIGIAIDVTALLIWFRKAPAGNWNGSGTANPATGVGGVSISALSGALYPMVTAASSVVAFTANFGGSAFSGAVPSGFTPGIGGPGMTTTALGTITVTSTSNTSATLAGSGGSLAVGDTLQIVAPTQDATLADCSITILAARV